MLPRGATGTAGGAESAATGKHAAALWIAPLIGVAVAHAWALAGDFVFDDITDLVDHPVVNGSAPLSDLLAYNYMGSPLGEGANTIRPLTTLLFALVWRAVGPAPLVFHALALLFYAGCVVAAQRVLRLWLEPLPAMFAALVFGVLAIHVEVAASIANSAEALSLLLAVLAFHAAARERVLVATLLYLAALLAKESAILLPLVVAWYWACREGSAALRPRRRGGTILWLLGAAVAYLLLRSMLLPLDIRGVILSADNPLLDASVAERLWMPFVLLGRYLQLTVAPGSLAADYTYAAIPVGLPPEGLGYGLLGVAFCAVAAGAMIGLRRREDARGLVFALGAFFLSYALFANTVFLNVTMFAERLFLAPSMWLVLASACAAQQLTARGRRLAAALALAVCATQIPLSAARSLDWRTTASLMAAQVEAQPGSVKGHMHYATALAHTGRWDEALWHLAVAADGRRAFPGPWHAPVLGADLSADERALRLPDVFAPGSDPLAYFGGLRRAATAVLGVESGRAVDDLVRRYMAAFPPAGK